METKTRKPSKGKETDVKHKIGSLALNVSHKNLTVTDLKNHMTKLADRLASESKPEILEKLESAIFETNDKIVEIERGNLLAKLENKRRSVQFAKYGKNLSIEIPKELQSFKGDYTVKITITDDGTAILNF